MSSFVNNNGLIAFLICGGKGTRIQKVSEGKPKALIPLFNRPAIIVLIDYLISQNIHNICLGLSQPNKAIEDVVTDYYGCGVLNIETIYDSGDVENGGAVLNYLKNTSFENVLCINADTFLHIDIQSFLNDHVSGESAATIAISKRKDQPMVNNIAVERVSGKVTCYSEAELSRCHDLEYGCNTGWALFNKKKMNSARCLNDVRRGKLETIIYPRLSRSRMLRCYNTGTSFLLDVGTVSNYYRALSMPEMFYWLSVSSTLEKA